MIRPGYAGDRRAASGAQLTIFHLVGLKKRQVEQIFHGSGGQGLVLLDGERGQAMPGLRRDDDARPTPRNHVAKLLQHERRAVEINFENRGRRSLARRDTGSMDKSGDFAQAGACSGGR